MNIAVTTVVVCFLPGLLVGWALPRGPTRWMVWSAALPLTLGLTAISMTWLTAFGLPDGPLPVLGAAYVVVLSVVFLSRWAYVRMGSGSEQTTWRPSRTDLLGFCAASVLALGVGYVIVGRGHYASGWDAMNHAFFTRRMIDTASTSMDAVCVTGQPNPQQACGFYPLAADVLWAQIAQLSGGTVGKSMVAFSAVAAPLAMVSAVFAASRRLGAQPLTATAVAVMPVFVGPLWNAVRTGRLTEQAIPCCVVAVALLMASAVRGPERSRVGLLAGITVAGVVLSHTYDVLFAATVAAAILVLLKGRLRAAGILSGAAALLVGLAPVLPQLASAGGERSAVKPAFADLAASLDFWIYDVKRYLPFGFPPPNSYLPAPSTTGTVIISTMVIVGLCAAPLAFAHRSLRFAWPLLISGVIWTVIGIWTGFSDGRLATAISGLWYGAPERPRSMIMAVYGPTALAGLTALALTGYAGIRALVPSRTQRAQGTQRAHARTVVSSAVVVAVTVAVCGLLPATWRPIRADIRNRTPNPTSLEAAGAWLRVHLQPGEVVAGSYNAEYVPWLYADQGIPTFFGIGALKGSAQMDTVARDSSYAHLMGMTSKNAPACPQEWPIGYVITSTRTVPDVPLGYTTQGILQAGHLERVATFPPLTIWQPTRDAWQC